METKLSRDEAFEMYQKGASLGTLAGMVGVSRQRMHQICREIANARGVVLRKGVTGGGSPKRKFFLSEEDKRSLESGRVKARDVAARIGCSPARFRELVLEAGITLPNQRKSINADGSPQHPGPEALERAS